MKYKDYTIKKTYEGYYIVYTPSMTLWQEVALSLATAKKWIDSTIIDLSYVQNSSVINNQ